jgi:hypothetical protein
MGWPTRPWYGDAERVVGAAVIGVLILVVLVALVVGRGSPPTGAAAPVVASGDGSPHASSSAAITSAQWNADTATLRSQLSASGGLVRRYVDAKDGVSLEPECATLGALVGDAKAHPTAPDAATARLWSDGVSFYATAATACGQLFDGTRTEVDVLLARTASALDDAERAWRELDASTSSRER